MELAYYNPRLAVWEPLLEPVEIANNLGVPEHRPWTVHFEVRVYTYPYVPPLFHLLCASFASL